MKKKIDLVYPVHVAARYLRNTGWWENVCANYSDERFKKCFKLSRGTFDVILQKVSHRLEKETLTDLLLSTQKRLAICLYKLGRGKRFPISKEIIK